MTETKKPHKFIIDGKKFSYDNFQTIFASDRVAPNNEIHIARGTYHELHRAVRLFVNERNLPPTYWITILDALILTIEAGDLDMPIGKNLPVILIDNS